MGKMASKLSTGDDADVLIVETTVKCSTFASTYLIGKDSTYTIVFSLWWCLQRPHLQVKTRVWREEHEEERVRHIFAAGSSWGKNYASDPYHCWKRYNILNIWYRERSRHEENPKSSSIQVTYPKSGSRGIRCRRETDKGKFSCPSVWWKEWRKPWLPVN